MEYEIRLSYVSDIFAPGFLDLELCQSTEPVRVIVADRDELERDLAEILARHPQFTRASVRPVVAK